MGADLVWHALGMESSGVVREGSDRKDCVALSMAHGFVYRLPVDAS